MPHPQLPRQKPPRAQQRLKPQPPPSQAFPALSSAFYSWSKRNRQNITTEAFKKRLAALLNVFETSLQVSFDLESGPQTSAGEYDIIVEFVGPKNSLAEEFERAMELSPSELSSLGAASISSAAPVTTTVAPPEDEEFPLVIVAAGAGIGLLLLIVGAIIYKKTQSAEQEHQNQHHQHHGGGPEVVAGDGYIHPNNSPRDGNGNGNVGYADQPMLQVPSMTTPAPRQQHYIPSGTGRGVDPDL